MIYIFTATYYEAQTFIRHFQLKKDTGNTRFQVFVNEENGVCLTVTGAGEIAAASAVSSICTEYVAGENDFLVNIGICAGNASDSAGTFYLCNKITELATGKTFYPDILYRHPFEERSIVTRTKIFRRNMEEDVPADGCDALYDMEAAAVYQAGAYFFGPHQMFFLKIISDDGTGSVLPQQVERLMESSMEPAVLYIEQLIHLSGEQRISVDGKDAGDLAWIQKLCRDMHCSKVMCEMLKQHIRYFALSGTDYKSAVEAMYGAGQLPCRDKREGKLRFEELKRKLL